MQSVKCIPIVKAFQWPLLVAVAPILLSSSGFAQFSGPCGENDCSITITSLDPLVEVVDITRPVVTHPRFNYGNLQPDDKITVIDAGGCVQTGGQGLTWKRYANPDGPKSDHLYFGSMELPGVLAKTRFRDLMGKTIEIPPGISPSLILYYEDDYYPDNGYYNPDPGTADQCLGADGGPAHVTLTIVHARTPVPRRTRTPVQPQEGPPLPWDLVALIQPDNPLRSDDNNFLLNPRWFWQTPGASQPPSSLNASSFPTNAKTRTDANLALAAATDPRLSGALNSTFITPLGGPIVCNGLHVNWTAVTYTGKLHWDGHSCGRPFGDDDYNIDIVGPTVLFTSFLAGGTSENSHGIHGEFAANETIDKFGQSSWWRRFHEAADADRTTNFLGICADSENGEGSHGGALIEGHDAVMTGLMGIDTVEHGNLLTRKPGAKAELHPVYALAIREAKIPNPADDAWAVFVRNWGNEGECSELDHPVERADDANKQVKSISIRFPRPLGIPPSAIAKLSPDTFTIASNVPSVGGESKIEAHMIPGGDAVLIFHLNKPSQKSYQFGEVHLEWAVPGATAQSLATVAAATPPAVAAATPPATGGEEEGAGDESAQLIALFNSLSPADREAVISRLEAAFPPETSPSELSTWTEVIGPPEPVTGDPIVYEGPDRDVAEVRAIGWGTLCEVTAGVTPLLPHFCTALNVAHIEAETFVAQSGGIRTFGSETGFGSGITDIDDGDWVRYPQVNFGDGTLDTFVALMARSHSGNHVEVHLDALDGEGIASIATERTGKDESDLGTFREQSASMASVTGVHDVFIVFKSKPRDGEEHPFREGHHIKKHHFRREHDIGNFDWFALRHMGTNEASR
jgi:Carbohydrate binding module (family 6)